jgi:formate hydrogenlyase subunit 4
MKLFTKQNAIVNRSETFFVFFFMIFIIFTGILFFGQMDLLLVIFALTLSEVFLILGAYSTNSPYSTMGAEREMLQVMAYEPMVLLVGVGFYLAAGSFAIKDIISSALPAIFYIPGVFLGFVYILTIKLRKSPFDLSTSHHAHQEIVKGITTEFSGPTLAYVEIAHWYENILLMGLVYLFFAFNSYWSIPIALLASAIVYFLEILVDNGYARVKWKIVLGTSWIAAATVAFINLIILNFSDLIG